MGNKKYSIGIDFGTLSGRSLLVDVATGEEIASAVLDYPHAVMDEYLDYADGKNPVALPPDWALEHPRDYLDVLAVTVPEVLKKAGVSADDVIGVGVDFTACTLMPVYKDGTPLCFDEKYIANPHAYIKLWKHHAAQSHANRINKAAEDMGEEWLANYGGKISSEWLFPKLWQTLEEAPEIYDGADYFIEAADWVIWQMTGVQTRNSCTAGYKAMFNKKNGYPSKSFFKALDPKLENVVADKLDCPISPLGSRAGGISAAGAALTGLKEGTAVAVANVDAHVTVPALGMDGAGKMLAIMGTSTCHMILGTEEKVVPGMCGVVADGILPGFFGYEAGQSCVGDHFAWFVDNYTPYEYKLEAKERGISAMKLMVEKASKLKPGESGIIALDWWNGNRSVLVDVDLSGIFIGMNLLTKPEELFRALIEATAFGTKKIVDTFRANGVEVNDFYAAGGIAEKDPFTMQIYSDVTGMEIKISGSPQAPALGSAIFGAAAAGKEAGGYKDVFEASRSMGKLSDKVYKPNPENTSVYASLYAEYETLHDYFGRGENNVMKRLRKIRADIKAGV